MDAETKEIILVLETIEQNPNVDIGILHEGLKDKISWNDFTIIFCDLSKREYINTGVTSLEGSITSLGENYLKDLKSKYETEEKIAHLTIKELEGNVFQVKKWWLIIVINFIISLITGIVLIIISKMF